MLNKPHIITYSIKREWKGGMCIECYCIKVNSQHLYIYIQQIFNKQEVNTMKEKNSLPCNRVINVDQVYKSGQLVKCIFNGQVVYMNKKDCKALWRGITVA